MGTSVKRDILRGLVSELKTRFGITISTGKLNSIDDCIEAVYKVCYETARRELLTEIEDTNTKITSISKIDEKIRMELEGTKKKNKKLIADLEEQEKISKNLFKDKELYKADIEKLKNSIIDLQDKNFKLANEKADVYKIIDVKDKDISSLLIKNDFLKSDVKRLEESLGRAGRTKENLEDKIHELEMKLENKRSWFERTLEKVFW